MRVYRLYPTFSRNSLLSTAATKRYDAIRNLSCSAPNGYRACRKFSTLLDDLGLYSCYSANDRGIYVVHVQLEPCHTTWFTFEVFESSPF